MTHSVCRELDSTVPYIVDLLAELRSGVDAPRAREIRLLLDGQFVEQNGLEPGDVVEVDGDGCHVCYRNEVR